MNNEKENKTYKNEPLSIKYQHYFKSLKFLTSNCWLISSIYHVNHEVFYFEVISIKIIYFGS